MRSILGIISLFAGLATILFAIREEQFAAYPFQSQASILFMIGLVLVLIAVGLILSESPVKKWLSKLFGADNPFWMAIVILKILSFLALVIPFIVAAGVRTIWGSFVTLLGTGFIGLVSAVYFHTIEVYLKHLGESYQDTALMAENLEGMHKEVSHIRRRISVMEERGREQKSDSTP